MINQKIEQDLIAGDEVIQRLRQETSKKISTSTAQQLVMEILTLQKLYKLHSKLSLKKMLIVSAIAFASCIGFFKMSTLIESTIPMSYYSNYYQNNPNDRLVQEYEKRGSESGQYLFFSFVAFLVPFAQAGVYFWTKSSSKKYIQKIEQTRSLLERAS